MKLHEYLLKVKSGKTINAIHLKSALALVNHNIDDIGELVHIKANTYKINILNPENLEKLIELSRPATSRSDATIRLGDSHKHGTDTAYFTYKTLNLPAKHGAFFCGSTTIIDNEWPDASITDIVLIENSECFTFSEAFLYRMGLDYLPLRTLIVWSAGKGITHSQAIRLLGSFRRIYYCPDYDLAGIEIFETLFAGCGDKVQFCMPKDLVSYSPYCKKPDNQSHFSQALKKAHKLGLTQMAALLERGKGILEQEVLLGRAYYE